MKFRKLLGASIIVSMLNPLNGSDAPFVIKLTSWIIIGVGVVLYVGDEE